MDLAFHGIDLAGEWRSRRWRRLLNLIDHLPRDSHYVEAQAADEELARAYLAASEDEPKSVERFSEWSPERAALARIEDRLAELIAVTVSAAGGKPGRVKPAERPVSAAQRLKVDDRRRAHLSLVARVLPRAEGVDQLAE